MQKKGSLLDKHRQNEQLPIRLVSPSFGHLSAEQLSPSDLSDRKSYYFFLLMLEGNTSHRVDLQRVQVCKNELLFVLPNQMHEPPATGHGVDYFKLGFDEECLSRLPRQYPFLINPLNRQKIILSASIVLRVRRIFETLLELLGDLHSDPSLILAHLNSLLAEIDTAYFSNDENPADGKLSKFIDFKIVVENSLTDHPTIKQIAEELTLNTNSLYNLVKQYSGLSPKEFIINRLILEARRRLYYSNGSSIKELAFELGFNDPEYFARLFKKVTGKTISAFFKDLSGKE